MKKTFKRYLVYESLADFRRGIVEDVTEIPTSKRAPQHLRNAEARLILISQGYPDTVMAWECKEE